MICVYLYTHTHTNHIINVFKNSDFYKYYFSVSILADQMEKLTQMPQIGQMKSVSNFSARFIVSNIQKNLYIVKSWTV